MVITILAGTACATSTATAPTSAATAPLSPSPVAESPGISPSPFAPPAAAGLTLTGSLNGHVTAISPQPGCGAANGGFVASDRFTLAGDEYELVVDISSYTGPGTYPAPPARVSIHKTAIDDTPRLLTGTAGTVQVAAGGVSGTVDEDLRAAAGPAHVSGAWTC